MKLFDKVIRGCAVLALVVAGVALWRAESRAAAGPNRAIPTSRPTATVAPRAPAAIPLDQVAPAPLRATPRAAPRVASTDRGPIQIARLVVARDVRDREPVGAGSEIELVRGEKLYAFVEVRNVTTERTLHVELVPDDGAPVGLVALQVAAMPRFRTWAFSRGVRRSGHWSVIVRDENSRVLAQSDFDVTMVDAHADAHDET